MFARMLLPCIAAALALSARAEPLRIEEKVIVDYRPVVARIESSDTATARSRLQGVVAALTIDEGSVVKRGELVARVVDSTIAPQISGLDSRIAGLRSQIRQQQDDLKRAESLIKDGFYPQAKLDEQKTALDVARRTLASAEAERRALIARRDEGNILAPADARVTAVNVVQGSVVSPGEIIASFATLDGVIRLSLPERHAGTLSEGETITLRQPSRDGEVRTASIVKIYPELRNGAVIADAVAENGLSALVGERVDVLASVGERRALVVPRDYVETRYGVDFVRVKVGDRFIKAPVSLASPIPDAEGNLEILSGLKTGDLIEKPDAKTKTPKS